MDTARVSLDFICTTGVDRAGEDNERNTCF